MQAEPRPSFEPAGAGALLVSTTALGIGIGALVGWAAGSVAYGAIAISVGWLSEQLHLFYDRAIEGERVAVVGQVAVAIRHEVNNALAAIIAEGQLLEQDGRLTHPEDVRSLENIIAMARRVNDSMEKLATVTHAPVTDYAGGVKMIDLTRL